MAGREEAPAGSPVPASREHWAPMSREYPAAFWAGAGQHGDGSGLGWGGDGDITAQILMDSSETLGFYTA